MVMRVLTLTKKRVACSGSTQAWPCHLRKEVLLISSHHQDHHCICAVRRVIIINMSIMIIINISMMRITVIMTKMMITASSMLMMIIMTKTMITKEREGLQMGKWWGGVRWSSALIFKAQNWWGGQSGSLWWWTWGWGWGCWGWDLCCLGCSRLLLSRWWWPPLIMIFITDDENEDSCCYEQKFSARTDTMLNYFSSWHWNLSFVFLFNGWQWRTKILWHFLDRLQHPFWQKESSNSKTETSWI